MKKIIKFLGITALIIVAGFTMAGCGSTPTVSQSDLQGIYRATDRLHITFSGNTFTQAGVGYTNSGTYTISGRRLILTFSRYRTEKWKIIDANTIRDDIRITYKKITQEEFNKIAQEQQQRANQSLQGKLYRNGAYSIALSENNSFFLIEPQNLRPVLGTYTLSGNNLTLNDSEGRRYDWLIVDANTIRTSRDRNSGVNLSLVPREQLVREQQELDRRKQANTTFQKANELLRAQRYTEAIAEYEAALGIENFQNANAARQLIEFAKRCQAKADSFNRSLRDDDFEVLQNKDNTITITKYKAVDRVQGITLTEAVIPASLATAKFDNDYRDRQNNLVPQPRIGWISNDLVRVTLPANMHDVNLEAFEESLRNFYISQNRAAGRYVKNGPIWKRE